MGSPEGNTVLGSGRRIGRGNASVAAVSDTGFAGRGPTANRAVVAIVGLEGAR